MTSFPNPKQRRGSTRAKSTWFPYYAGYSSEFVSYALGAASDIPEIRVLDPWNGTGTTTSAADELGVSAWGFDLNPVMTLAARSRLLGRNVEPSLESLARDVLEHAFDTQGLQEEPLTAWLTPSSADRVRALERSINRVLVSPGTDRPAAGPIDVEHWSALAAFFYVALFKVVQELLHDFATANPSWISEPKHPSARLRPSTKQISSLFLKHVSDLVSKRTAEAYLSPTWESRATVRTGSATSIPLDDACIDFVLSSPPYCTRLDYAIATRLELAVLGFGSVDFRSLRERLLGTTAIARSTAETDERWGTECTKLLRAIDRHPSKGSRSYYWKNHVQYFGGLYDSLAEITRVLARPGYCTLVVQDSYYKNLHTKLAEIVTQMAHGLRWRLLARQDFASNSSMAALHVGSPHPGALRPRIESVLQFALT